MIIWFTIEKIDNKTYAISEYQHWEESHSYLLLGSDKALLIDTGLGISNIKEIVDEITNLLIIVATTYIHWNGISLISYPLILQKCVILSERAIMLLSHFISTQKM